MSEDWQRALEIAESAALEAGRLVLDGFRSRGRVTHKGKFDLVTEFDFASEELIRARIEDAFPEHRIVGEEGEATGAGRFAWYVDPIDGTVNFAHGHPYFCVSIGLFRETEGLVGVVHAPALGLTWKAAKHQGSFRNDEPCRVSERSRLDEALCTTGFPGDMAGISDTNEAEIGAFARKTRGIRRCGSAAIDLAMVADGTYDIYWERALRPWDIAGGMVVIAEAGGVLTGYEGASADPRAGEIVATNGLLHSAALDVIAQARKSAFG